MSNAFITPPSPSPVRHHGVPSKEGMDGYPAFTNELKLIIYRSHNSSSLWETYSRKGQYLHHRISNHMRLPDP